MKMSRLYLQNGSNAFEQKKVTWYNNLVCKSSEVVIGSIYRSTYYYEEK